MPPDKCVVCKEGKACINGKFCKLFRKYVEYIKVPLCNK